MKFDLLECLTIVALCQSMLCKYYSHTVKDISFTFEFQIAVPGRFFFYREKSARQFIDCPECFPTALCVSTYWHTRTNFYINKLVYIGVRMYFLLCMCTDRNVCVACYDSNFATREFFTSFTNLYFILFYFFSIVLRNNQLCSRVGDLRAFFLFSVCSLPGFGHHRTP